MRLGIDIGGTNIALGLLEEDGTLVKSASVKSFAKDASLDSTLQTLKDRIREFLTDEVTGIGIGVPSALDPETGVIYNAINIPSWQNFPSPRPAEQRRQLLCTGRLSPLHRRATQVAGRRDARHGRRSRPGH